MTTTRPLACWDPQQRILITHADDDVRVIENVAGHDVSRTVPLVDASELHATIAALRAEIVELHADLAATERDPFGTTAQWRGGSVCGNESCPCAAPNLPCREWMGCAETGAYCPCCGWNEAAHRIAREVRRRAVQVRRESRPVVAKVSRVRKGVLRGWWLVALDGVPSEHYILHDQAIQVAYRKVRARTRRLETAS